MRSASFISCVITEMLRRWRSAKNLKFKSTENLTALGCDRLSDSRNNLCVDIEFEDATAQGMFTFC